LLTLDVFHCPNCKADLRVDLFPSFFSGLPQGDTGEILLDDSEASCFYHPQKKAVIHCETCGRFLCSLCDLEFKNRHICPSCLEHGRKKEKTRDMANHRILYDHLALWVAALPLLIFWITIVTAPMALYLSIKHWNSPSGIIPRSRARFIAAIIIAIAQIVGWIGFLIIGLTNW
jgi:hypothetical protein